jgi:Ran GTPase-activating protein (RanGAP) involved in mRNA processing and transport
MRNWKDDPKAVEAVEYLLGIGMNADEFLQADIEESSDLESDDADPEVESRIHEVVEE